MKINNFRSHLTTTLLIAFLVANSTVHAQNDPGKIAVLNAKTRTGSVTYVVASDVAVSSLALAACASERHRRGRSDSDSRPTV